MSLIRRPSPPRSAAPVQADLNRLAALARQREEEYMTFRSRIKINRDRLDDAIQEQAEVYLEVCERSAVAASIRDKARDDLARKDADLARTIRRDQTNAKGGSPKDSIVNDEVMLHPEHQAVSDAVDAAKKIADQWGALVKAFEQRMRMLRELVSLYNSGYWTTQGAGAGARDSRDGIVQRVREERAQRARQPG